jgi:hypothetical protein
MADVHHPGLRPPTGTQRRRFVFVILIAGLVVAVGVIALTERSDHASTSAPSAPVSTATLNVTTTTIGEREEVVARLRTILRVRDRAYRERVWVGASTSIEVKEIERASDRLWVVVATFIGSPFRIETESGNLIRSVEGRSEPFRFALARDESHELLLGFAGPVDESD